MSITIDPEVLLAARRVLLHHEQALRSVRVVAPPETGDTGAVLDRVATVVDALATDLRGLADALAELVADLERRDDGVGHRFDRLRARSLA